MKGAWKLLHPADPRDFVPATRVSSTQTDLIKRYFSTLSIELNIEQKQSCATRKSDLRRIKFGANFAH
jgi:GDP-D-mannose dehydratase